jgi:hypothetical protein
VVVVVLGGEANKEREIEDEIEGASGGGVTGAKG